MQIYFKIVYFTLFLVGFWGLIKKKKFIFFVFSLAWIILPFVYLYFVRLGHWFEEKYFIFIIPVYLLVIAEGIVFISRFLAKNLVQIIFVFFIFFLALNPIKIRTTYGFPVPADYHYSPKAAYQYVQKNMGSNDRLFVPLGQGVFPEFYFGPEFKNKVWFEEDYVLFSSAEEYQRMAEDGRNNYFVTVNDFKDIFLNGVTNYQLIKNVGVHGIYKLYFLKNNNLKLVPDEEGNWGYYDDFTTARYISDANDWSNLISTYIGKDNLPITYGYYNLSPYEFKDADIVYHFILPPNKGFFMKPLFFLNKGAVFKVSLGRNEKEMKEIYYQETQEFSYFNPLIKIEGNPINSEDIFLKMEFIIDKKELKHVENVGLKSLWVFNQFDKGKKDYQITLENKTLNYAYSVNFEANRDKGWLRQASANEGWTQLLNGSLYRLYGQPENNPLTYEFKFPKTVTEFNLDLKTYISTNELNELNELDVYANIDGQPSHLLQIKGGSKEETHHLVIGSGKNFEIKFICQKEGKSCQLKGIYLNAKMVQ